MRMKDIERKLESILLCNTQLSRHIHGISTYRKILYHNKLYILCKQYFVEIVCGSGENKSEKIHSSLQMAMCTCFYL